jgi:hypothetical protein
MHRFWPVLLVVVGLGALGLTGVLTAPLGSSEAAREAQRRFDAVPRTIGAWSGTDRKLSERQLALAEAQANLYRTYRRDDPPAAVSVVVLFGDSGPLGAHTPEVCYEGSGFKQVSGERKRTVPGTGAELWTAKFEAGGVPPLTVEVVWGWGADGEWKAAENPRLEFAHRRQIYKLYVSRVVPVRPEPDGRTSLDEFLGPFLQEFQAALSRPLE